MLFLPIGLIGIIRWAVWLLKKAVGASYRPDMPDELTPSSVDVSVVIPVYNEDPEIFAIALDSWLRDRPREIVAVIDVTDRACAKIFEDRARTASEVHLQLITVSVEGKRPALARGIEEARGEILALVDSDTIWEPGALPKLVAPFADPEVGGVTCRQRVYKPRTLADRLMDLMLDIRYEDEMRFLGRLGQGFSCLSGRTAVYRRSALVPIVPEMLNETFWGRSVMSGEDKRLTYLLQSRGHRTRYQASAIVYTSGPGSLITLMKQRIRWTRNSWRADLRALSQGWLWRRRPMLALYLVDRIVSSFTVLISPMIVGLAIYLEAWLVAGAVPLWWLGTRAIKAAPYLRSRPLDFWMVPVYVLASFASGLIKIYALMTLNTQGWLTRGHATASPRLLPRLAQGVWGLALTGGAISALALGVVAYARAF